MLSRRPREPRLRDLFRTRSPAMRNVLETVEKVLDHDVSVLILGESGSGKDYLAAAIHACGARRDTPFVHVECASIPPDLFETELFGHERGTFTDAHARKVGRLEAAGRGTVYLDEITALAPELQAKLLRAIQERRFSRLGGSTLVPLEARLLSSSSGDLAALLDSGALRRDFYYRVNVVSVTIPPLRQRREDIPGLATMFLRRARTGRDGVRRPRGFSDDAMHMLLSHSWPGNIRELRNVVERAALVEEGEEITINSLPVAAPADLVNAATQGSWTLAELESRYIRQILLQTRSNYSMAAGILGINRKTLLEKRRKYGIE